MMDLVFAIGCYEILAMVFNSYRVALEKPDSALDPATRKRMHGA